MSEGPRIELSRAVEVSDVLFERWKLPRADVYPGCMVVGSVRRMKPEVGDIEMVAPLPRGWDYRKLGPEDDELFGAINATVDNPWSDESAPLFAATPPTPPVPPVPTAVPRVLGSAVRGLKPGFLACSLLLRPWDGLDVPCQVYRYTPENLGWMLIERTGPREFGMWFLGQWKRRYGIPVGVEGRQASVNNHLVNAGGVVVPVPTEAEAFRLCGMAWIEPWDRDGFMERLAASREALR